MKRFGLVIFALLLLTGCSSTPSEVYRFQSLDYDAKSVFLAYYPFLTQGQKNTLLENQENPRKLIQSWKGDLNDPHHQVGTFSQMMGNPNNRRITAFQIVTDAPEPVTDRSQITVHAFATFANGRKIDVTPDVVWRVEPNLGSMDGNVLTYSCVHSDLTITGNFLGVRESSKVIPIRKPLQSLDVRVSDAYIGDDSGYNFQLVLVARCKDGTSANVSCQGTWRSAATGGRIEGCGNFIVTSKQKLRDHALTVLASYGNLKIRKTLHPPIR